MTDALMLFDDDHSTTGAADGRIKNSTKSTTLISELATALGMIRKSLPEAIAYLPSELNGVTDTDWATLAELHSSGKHETLFNNSFANGRAFATSEIALRHRQPGIVEWCGPRKVRGESAIPADLRVDDVYLISCKYDSKNLLNSGPAKLFDHRLNNTRRAATSWYEEVADDAYQEYYSSVRDHYGFDNLPLQVSDLTDPDRAALAAGLPRELPSELADEQAAFCLAVATATAERWRKSIGATAQLRTDFAMSMLRIPQAIYFLLGQSGQTELRFKVLSRWDWAARYQLRDFSVQPSQAMQPSVLWKLVVFDRDVGQERTAFGHVEIRWSHGRFNKQPEAKVYLDSTLATTPGYVLL